MDNTTSILALRCRAVQPLRVGEVPSIRSTRTPAGGLSPARRSPVSWFARFRRENFHFRLDEFYDPGSGYAAAIFFILGAAALVFGVITLAESILSRLRW